MSEAEKKGHVDEEVDNPQPQAQRQVQGSDALVLQALSAASGRP